MEPNKINECEQSTCGIIEIFSLRSCKPIVEMSTPSIIIDPSKYASLNRPWIIDDFPAPVLPTIPICNIIIIFRNW